MSKSQRTIINLLDRLENTGKLTDAGKEWVIAACDPFHDFELNVTGFPDTQTAASVVQLVKQTFTVSAPAGVGSSTWDVNIFNTPWVTSSPMSQYQLFSVAPYNTIQNVVGTPPIIPMGGIVACAQINSTSAASNCTPFASNTFTSTLAIPDNYMQGSSRAIAAGFEVVNTTAEIQLQGQAIAYRVPQPASAPVTFNISDNVGATTNGCVSCYKVSLPAGTAAQAMLLAGSRQWAAKEGAYMPMSFASVDLPTIGDWFAQPMFANDGFPNGPSFGPVITQTLVPYVVNTVTGSNNSTSVGVFNTHGVYFTGLSPTTTLSVTFNCYVERFPSFAESDLIVLAKPSPKYDLFALEVYSHAMHSMPPGVMVRENGLGDWFADVIKRVDEAFGGSLRSTPNPYAQVIGQGLGVAHQVSDFLMPPNSKVEGKKQKQKLKKKMPPAESQEVQFLRNEIENLKRTRAGKAPPRPPRQAPRRGNR
jgi:hypothetical protein